MSDTDSIVKQLLEAGIHYGHKSAGWNPKMKPYIFGKRNGIHIIDVRQTVRGLLLASRFLTRVVASGKSVLFIGTKRQAAPTIEKIATEVGMPYVTERWLGGTLTNFRTIRSRLKRLEELEALMASEGWSHYSKKMASQLTRERRKIHRNLSGIRTMHGLPGALVVVDVRREINSVREAQSLGIPVVGIIDTDSDPALADIPIPANDDAMRAVELLITHLGAAVAEGKTARAQQDLERKSAAPGEQGGRKRSGRSQFRADESEKPQTDDAPADTATATAETHAPSTPESTDNA